MIIKRHKNMAGAQEEVKVELEAATVRKEAYEEEEPSIEKFTKDLPRFENNGRPEETRLPNTTEHQEECWITPTMEEEMYEANKTCLVCTPIRSYKTTTSDGIDIKTTPPNTSPLTSSEGMVMNFLDIL